MPKTGDELICMGGNTCYTAGETYIVGRIVSEKYFEIMTGSSDDRWYATIDEQGIYVRFNHMQDLVSDAWFSKLIDESGA